MNLRIAIMGTRGIPNFYGGFEQLAEHLAPGLVRAGHEVTVYNSHNHPQLPARCAYKGFRRDPSIGIYQQFDLGLTLSSRRHGHLQYGRTGMATG